MAPKAPLDEREKMASPDKQTIDAKKKRTKHKGGVIYQSYVYKVLKQVHPKMRISKSAMDILESCVGDTFERIAGEAMRLLRTSRKDTMNTREIQSAVRLVFPGELSRHAMSEGSKAVIRYQGRGGEFATKDA